LDELLCSTPTALPPPFCDKQSDEANESHHRPCNNKQIADWQQTKGLLKEAVLIQG
jgi:hypothetical protein